MTVNNQKKENKKMEPYQFRTYKISATITGKGGWYWQVTQEAGPAELVVARSGISYLTEDNAVAAYKDMIAWACTPSTPASDTLVKHPPPPVA